MDFDSDGVMDILTGCWPGELYFFKGEGRGKFAAAEKIRDKDGNLINCGSASTVFAHDFNGDGRLDLLVGCIEGHIFLLPGEGDSKKHAFGKPVKLQADGKEIQAPGGDSQPVVADWNGDGKPDLLVGCGDGSVLWHRNVGSKTEPKLEAGRTLLPAPARADKPQPGQRGSRAKVCAVDYNGDGRLDLLVGDFHFITKEKPQLTEEQKTAQKEADAKYEKIMKDLQPYFEARRKELGPVPKDPAQREAWQKKAEELAKPYEKLFAELQEVSKTRAGLQGGYGYEGYVWLLLAQP